MPARDAKDRCPSKTRAALNQATSLHGSRKLRSRKNVFSVEGVRNFVRAIDAGFVIKRILFSEKLLIHPLARKLVRQCRRAGVETLNVSPEQFRKLSTTKRASGIYAIVEQKWLDLADIAPAQHLCWTVLETVQSPGNFGTLIRSSQAAGGAGFILVGPNVDPYAPAVIRSAMGAVFRQSFVRTDYDALRTWVEAQGCPVIGASPTAADDLHQFAFPARPPLLVLGEERKGLSTLQNELCGHLVRIPMHKGADSLNLGVAGSLLLYEVHRSQSVLSR